MAKGKRKMKKYSRSSDYPKISLFTDFGFCLWLVKFILALRADMSITAVARLTGLHWQSIKDIEKTYLTRKYHKVR